MFLLVSLMSHLISNLSSASCHIRVKKKIPEQIQVLGRLLAREPALIQTEVLISSKYTHTPIDF